MAKQTANPRPTKKHLARAQREAILRKRIIAVSVVLGVILIALIGYSVIDKAFIEPNTVIMTVNGEEFYVPEFQSRMEQYYSLVGVTDPVSVGASVLEEMMEEALIRAEAARREIVVSEEDIDAAIQQVFGFIPEEEAAAAVDDEGNTDPEPVATPYTYEMYEDDVDALLDQLRAAYGITEEEFREDFEISLYQEKIADELGEGIERMQEHIQLQHILVADEETAQEVKERLDAGEDWDALVEEYSLDTLTSDAGGDLGWLSLTDLVSLYGEIGIGVFGYPEGDIMPPVQAEDGWHIFRVMGREERELSDITFQNLVSSSLNSLLDTLKSEAEIEIVENWIEYIPAPPVQLSR